MMPAKRPGSRFAKAAKESCGTRDMPKPEEVHVWLLPLDLPAGRASRIWSLLSPDERKRADRFGSELNRSRFVACRGHLRMILGPYLGLAPSRLEFEYGRFGKPTVVQRPPGPEVTFSVSHSADVGMVGVSAGGRIGVDVERIRPLEEADQIARMVLGPAQFCQYSSLSEEARKTAFFNLWTRKEAYLKARGEGLSRAAEEIEVNFLPGQPARLGRVLGEPLEACRWTMLSPELLCGCACSLVTEHRVSQLTVFGRPGGKIREEGECSGAGVIFRPWSIPAPRSW